MTKKAMTGMCTGQMPGCCWRNRDVNKAYSKKQKQKQKPKNSSDQQMVPQFTMFGYFGLCGQLANCFVN